MMMVFHFLRSIALFLTVGSIAVTLPTCHASNTNNDVEGCDSSSSNNRHYLKGPHEALPLEDERVTTGNTDQAQDDEDSSRHHHRVMEEEVITPSIVGGTEVSPRRKYPFFVWLNGCGGALVAPNAVLSAAHCASKLATPAVATLGMHKLRLDDNVAADLTEFEHIVHIPIERSEIHPRYNSNTSAYDFWMIKLKWNADSSFPPVHLQEPADLPIPAGRELTTMGFGTTEDGFPSNVLREVTVKYVTNPVCADMYVSLQRWIFDSMLCAAATDKDSCLGDAGGPLMDGHNLVGIVSGGEGCADPLYPGVYARITEGYDFITTKIDEWADLSATPPTRICDDAPGGFYDKDGTEYNCLWYEAAGRCAYQDSYEHAGKSAHMACCACGGGTPRTGITNAPTQRPTNSPTSRPTPAPTPSNPPPTRPPVPFEKKNGRPFWNHLF